MIGLQGQVVGVDAPVAMIQCYSWADGSPTIIETMPKAGLYDPEKCRLYGSAEQMRQHYEMLRRLMHEPVECSAVVCEHP